MRGRGEGRMEIKGIKRRVRDREREGKEGQKRKAGEKPYLGRNWSPHFWVEIIRDSQADI